MNGASLYINNDLFHKYHRLPIVIELAKTHYKIVYGKLFNCPNPLIKTTSSLFSNNVPYRLKRNWYSYLNKIIHKILVIKLVISELIIFGVLLLKNYNNSHC